MPFQNKKCIILSMIRPTCSCSEKFHQARFIVITGGPGAGKTAVLEAAKRMFCPHVAILPEAASILFSGGFLRHNTDLGRCSAQRAIFYVQRELENLLLSERQSGLILCDRGTLDGMAYWPGSEESFWRETGSDKTKELNRYAAVIHLRTPPLEKGYNYENPMRTETAAEATAIDERIFQVWADHPRRFIVESKANFLQKIVEVTELIRQEVPLCCRVQMPIG